MALAAIEIYNKPGFHNREHVFCILMISAWESLTKAKLLKDNGNRVGAIRERDKKTRRYIRTRHGDYKTIDVWESAKATIDSFSALENVNHLIRLRNEFVHYMPQTKGLVQLMHALATASLDNYAFYINEWFGISVARYNFFILPLGFEYPFTKLSAVSLSREPVVVQEIIRGVIQAQNGDGHQVNDRALVLEIGVDMVSAKKAMRDPDYYTNISDEAEGVAGYIDQRDFNDRYPYKFRDMLEKVKIQVPTCGRPDALRIIKTHEVKKNPKLSGYFYTDRADRERGPTEKTSSRYNDDCVKFIASTFRHEQSQT